MVANSLSGCRVKINRARQHFAELEKEFDAWFLKKPYTVWYYSDLKTRSMVHQLRIQDSVPASWGGIVGDVVHNLRSAFDILAHALVLANGGTPGDHTLFPFSRRREDLISSRIPSCLKGANDAAKKLARRLKPYDAPNSTFWRLHRMDIADKHYELIAVGSANPSIEFTIPRGDGTFVLDGFAHDTGHPLLLLEDGMILMESSQPREFGDFYRYAFSMAFLEGTPWGARPVFDTLDELIGFTERAIDIFARRILNCTW